MNKTINTLSLPGFLNERGIGFNTMLDQFTNSIAGAGQNGTYPPYNLLQLDDNNFAVEVALAGFSETDVSITKDGNVLSITGEKKADESETKSEMYLHRGISSRTFTREFMLAEHIDVVGATMKDGILLVQLKREIPEEKKPRQITIKKIGE